MTESRVAARRMIVPLVVQFLYLLSVFSAVLPFGAVNPIPIAFATIMACLSALISALVFGLPARTGWLFATALVLTILTVAWVEFQTLATVGAGLANPLWNDLDIAGVAHKGSISVEPAASIAALPFLAVPLLTFLAGLTVIRSDVDGRRFLTILSVGGGFCAVYGLVQFEAFPDTNLFFPKTAYMDSLTATFVNRNTAATFLGLVCLALARHAWSLSREVSLSVVMRQILANRPIKMAGLSFFLFIVALFGCSLIALFLTKSRGGIASSIVALLFLVSFLALQQSARPVWRSAAGASRRKTFLKLALISGFLLLVLGALGSRAFFRAETQTVEDPRYCVLPGIIQLARGEPLLGYGFGAFRYAFPPYRDPQCGIIFIWERAHNFFLEGFIGLGAMFGVIVVVGVSALMIAQLVGVRNRRRMRSYGVLGLASMVLVGLHGLVDFSLQIPGMAAYFAALMAATSTISLGKSSEAAAKTPL